jgi:hypothetical protein
MSAKTTSLEHADSPEHTEADYRAIEAAVMETARGRWFLAEHAKRNRTIDTERVLALLNGMYEAIQSRLGHINSDGTQAGGGGQRLAVAPRLERYSPDQPHVVSPVRQLVHFLESFLRPTAEFSFGRNVVSPTPNSSTPTTPITAQALQANGSVPCYFDRRRYSAVAQSGARSTS